MNVPASHQREVWPIGNFVNIPSGMVYLGGRGAKLLSVSRQKFLELSTLRVQLPEPLLAASETHGLWQFQIYI
jgi:hypothetical protein